MGLDAAARAAPGRTGGLEVWTRLAGWSDQAPPPPSGHEPVSAAETRARLTELLGAEAEARPQQADYASAVSQAFAPRAEAGAPNLVLAEAGTGVGKTLGYIAPASLWAEKNEGPVWLSMLGFVAVARYDSINEYLMPSVLYVWILSIPMLDYFELWTTPLMILHPLQGALVLIQAAFLPVAPVDFLTGLLSALVWIGISSMLGRRAYQRFVIRKEGVS